MRQPDYTRRVVVTGLGVVSPVGNDKDTAWNNLLNGVSGLGVITKFDASRYAHKAAGEVHDFDPSLWMDAKARPAQRARHVVRRLGGQAGHRGRGPRDHGREPRGHRASSSAPAPAASS